VTTPHLDRGPRQWRSKAQTSGVDEGAGATAENANWHRTSQSGDAPDTL